MISASREDLSYRRGLVLGLTMAEIIILIIFVLLLALSLVLSHKNDEMERLAKELALKETEFATLKEASTVLEQLAGGKDSFENTFRELVLKRRKLDQLEEKAAALEEKAAQLTRELTAARKKAEAYEKIEQAFSEAGLKADKPRELAAAAENLSEAREMKKALEQAGIDPSDPAAAKEQIANLTTAREAAARLEAENKSLKDRNKSLEDSVDHLKGKRGGRSDEYPPCWTNPNSGKTEYIYDVALTAEGIVIYDLDLPHRRADKTKLPLAGIVRQKPLSNSAFLDQTRALFDWSNTKECRFFVRVFDLTGITDKQIYIDRLYSVEQHFFKLQIRDPNAMPGL
jgi:Tfp pilus assembly protein PilO